jgi:ABC-type transport system involved in cytochrome c biogenesis ATPase subunit
MWTQQVNTPDVPPVLQWQGLTILPGLNAVTGDEGSGKTHLLRTLAESTADALWLDLRLPEHDEHTPEAVWAALQARCPDWNAALQTDLQDALHLQEHLGKRLFMLSAGSRRKVALVGLLASGATITCIDQPYAALDMASVRVLQDFLNDMAEHPTRAWVVADYEADATLPWRSVSTLLV